MFVINDHKTKSLIFSPIMFFFVLEPQFSVYPLALYHKDYAPYCIHLTRKFTPICMHPTGNYKV